MTGPTSPGPPTLEPSTIAPIKVAVLEERPLIAEGLAELLGRADIIDIVGATTVLAEALRMITDAGVEVVVFGAAARALPDALEVLAEIGRVASSVGRSVGTVCVVAADTIAADVLRESTASTVITTGASLENLAQAVVTAHVGGGLALPLRLLRHTVTSPIARRRASGSDLTARERDVLKYMASGSSTREIAAQLGVSVNTVRTHVQHLLPKLGAHNRLQATAIAATEGLIGEVRNGAREVDGQ